jgi:hypothetical protein
MRERSGFPRRLTLILTLAALAPLAHARSSDDRPTRFLGNDHGLVTAANPLDARLWAAWSYRTGAETDIAVSARDAAGTWSEPVFLGLGDGRNQLDPVLAFDAAGNLYLAHSVKETGEVFVLKLAVGATRMSAPLLVSLPGEKATSPTLMLADNYLIIGYRVGSRVMMRAVTLAAASPLGIQDGPDGFPPTRSETEGEEEGEATGIGEGN